MKVSLKLQDHQQQNQTPTPTHFKAKIPITVFNLPFLSAFSATHNHSSPSSDQLSLSLRTHFSSGPTLKLSYNTTATAAPFTLTLKSGVSLFGSPNNSPLIISANFSISPQNPNPNPNFTIQFKHTLGSFSLRKSIPSTVSNNVNGKHGGENLLGFVPLDRPPNIWKELTVKKDSILAGILVAADTELPVTKRVKVKLRWGVGCYENKLPNLSFNKIKVERVEFDDVEGDRKQGIGGEFEVLKGMCYWMRGELSDLRKENGEMRRALEEVVSSLKNWDEYGGGKRGVGENADGFERWRMKKGNGQRETKQAASCSSDVESELQKAIKAASAQ